MTTVEDAAASGTADGGGASTGDPRRSPARQGQDGRPGGRRPRRRRVVPIALVIGVAAGPAALDGTPAPPAAGPATPDRDTSGGAGAPTPAAVPPGGSRTDDIDNLHAQVSTEMAEHSRRHQLSTLAVVSDLLLIRDTLDAGVRPGSDATVAICRRELEVARQAVAAGARRRGGRDLWLELAWHSVHRARALLPLVVPDDAVETQYLYATQRLGRARPRDAELLSRLGAAAGDHRAVSDRGRRLLSYALSRAYAAADTQFRRVRKFRDRLVRTAWVMAGVTACLVLAGALVPDAVPLCTEGTTPVCPTGRSGPTGGDVATVAGFGVLGAALAGVLAVRRAQPTSSPYRISPALAGLRAGLGGVLSVVGVLVVQAQVVPGIAGLTSPQQVAVYAIVFGFAQELVTRLLENRAASVQEAAAPPPPAGRARQVEEGLDGAIGGVA